MRRKLFFVVLVLAGLVVGGWLQMSAPAQAQLSPAPPVSSVKADTTVPDGTRKLPPSASSVKPVAPDSSYRPFACTAAVVNVSQRSGNEAESQVVINPTNPNNIVAFSNLASGNSIFRAYSTDGGASWTRGTVATNVACCDAQAAFDSFGNLFMVYINGSVNQINVVLSTDGGATFGAPVTAGTGSVDQPSIAVGNGSVWVDWNLSGNMQARGAPVTGLGTWGPFNALQTIPGGTGSFGGIAVGPGPNGGKVMVTYQNPTGGQGPATIFANVDADGLGAGNFGTQITVSNTNVGGFDFIPAQSGRSVDAEAGLVWDATGGPFNNRAYLVYTEELVNESNDTEIYMRTSTNDGATWTAPVRVNDDPLGPIRSQFLPYVTLDRSTGTVAVGWHDSRNDSGVVGVGGTNTIPNDDSEYFASYSTDGGVTWAANTRLSGGWSNDNGAANGVDYGDYVAQDAYGGKFVAVWADNSNCDGTNANGTLSAFDLYMGILTLPAQGTPTPTATGTPPTATRTRTSTPTVTRTNTATAVPTACGQGVFSNPAPITINDAGPASPYPSNITVAGAGTIASVSVSITGISHTWPDDIDMLLVGPNGGKVLLMSDAGGSNDVAAVNLTFQDGAPAIPDSAQITSGTYAPADYEAGDVFPAPAPAGPYGTSLNTAFVGSNPNGTWSLYIVDDAGADLGSIAGGWSLTIGLTGGCGTASATPVAATATRTSTVAPSVTTQPSNPVVPPTTTALPPSATRTTVPATAQPSATRTTVPATAQPTATRTTVPATAQPTATNTAVVATVTPCPIQFTDVAPTDPFYPFIRCLVCRGLISG
ncbi:MAG TPA: proprotein convertase P-domain-containing protein, partial [Chloroflexia bacterium]|nr:proprotein convertase P-domain-containing protein [Chloroflexia bacterium]